MRIKGKKIKVDDLITQTAMQATLTYYCYRFDDCNNKCKLVDLCNEKLPFTGGYGDFEKWTYDDIKRGMELVDGRVALRCANKEVIMTVAGAIEHPVNNLTQGE